MGTVSFGVLVTPVIASAALVGMYGKPEDKVCGFLGNINDILNIASITVLAIAAIVSGVGIAFAHKRLADVAPILIGGLLIGAAAQIANMLIDKDTCSPQRAVAQADQRH